MAKANRLNLTKVLQEIFLEGGMSYNITTGQTNPKTGFMVSILGFEEKIDLDKADDQFIKDYVLRNATELWGDNRYLGAWLDADTVILDVSVNIQDMTQACYTGIINKQKCIYDCANKVYIYLPSPQTCGTEAQQKAYAKMKAEQLVFITEITGVE